MALLDVRNVQKIYRSSFSSLSTLALQDVSFSIERGEFTAIMGESGSGKSTLLHILAGLDAPTSGSVLIDGEDLYSLSAKKRSAFRRNHLGFVFQDYALLDTFTLRDNILLPLVLNRTAPAQMEEKCAPSPMNLAFSPSSINTPLKFPGTETAGRSGQSPHL